jgi:hypothetical protein
MILDDNEVIGRVLSSGICELSALRRELIDAFFLTKIPAPKRFFRAAHQMCGREVDAQIQQAFSDLRQHFERHGIKRVADFCLD